MAEIDWLSANSAGCSGYDRRGSPPDRFSEPPDRGTFPGTCTVSTQRKKSPATRVLPGTDISRRGVLPWSDEVCGPQMIPIRDRFRNGDIPQRRSEVLTAGIVIAAPGFPQYPYERETDPYSPDPSFTALPVRRCSVLKSPLSGLWLYHIHSHNQHLLAHP